MFFGSTQKQNLPLLNLNAKEFNPDTLIKTHDKLHESCELHNQRSLIIEDLVPGGKIYQASGLTQQQSSLKGKKEDLTGSDTI